MDPELESDLDRIVRSVWSSLLGLDVRRLGPEAPTAGGRSLVASIGLQGARRLGLILKCPAPLARRAAGIMFRAAPETLPIEDVEDSLGELANITGGHLKSLLPGGAALQLPVTAVIEDADDRPRLEPGGGLCQVAFDCEGQSFSVAVVR